MSQNMTDKVVLVTGANSGIGKETALGLAKQNARIVMVCRNQEKGAAARTEIIASSGNNEIELLIADMASFAAIRQLAKTFVGKYDWLDVLINNAGGLIKTRQETRDGIETTFAVNYLGPFLLTNLLLNRLKQSAPGRIINVSSGLHARGSIDFDDLMMTRRYGVFQAYSNAKLAITLFTYELARRLEGTGVIVNAVHPGVARTNFARNSVIPWYGMPIMLVFVPFMISAKKGAETLIHLASSPEMQSITGRYFAKGREARSAAQSYNVETRRQLWDVSTMLTELDQ